MFRPIRLAQAIVLAGVAALIAVPTVFADDAPATANVTGGSLSESTSSTPSVSVTLNGTNQVPTYTMDIATNDQTGSGSGWNLTITSTRFETAGGKFFANTASQVTGVTAACVGHLHGPDQLGHLPADAACRRDRTDSGQALQRGGGHRTGRFHRHPDRRRFDSGKHVRGHVHEHDHARGRQRTLVTG